MSNEYFDIPEDIKEGVRMRAGALYDYCEAHNVPMIAVGILSRTENAADLQYSIVAPDDNLPDILSPIPPIIDECSLDKFSDEELDAAFNAYVRLYAGMLSASIIKNKTKRAMKEAMQ